MWEGFKQYLFEAVNWLWDNTVGVLLSLVKTVFDMLKDWLFWLVETAGSFAMSALDTLGSGLTFNPAQYFNDLPAEVKNIVGLVGVGEAMTIIIAGIVIRLLLQLIPFVRLGS